ncbi:MAG: class I SAM-dependent RNA methyltransferase [Saprospiraceae bacterium]|nr:class I SAM-dependent RNA methyltransferase [Saprospiraceae bacterium]
MDTFIVKTLAGLEPVLAAELNSLGASGVRELKRAVAFDGDREMMYRANYELRTALRVLLRITSFTAYNERNYYGGISEIDWSKYMGAGDTLAVDAIVSGSVFTHSQFLAQLTKDAIVDQFRDKYGRRPSVNTVAPTLRVNIHAQGTNVIVLLDSSGDSLHRRNYRKDTVEAPLNEVLAAGMIMHSGWDAQSTFVDPMCGSGTIPIEAAMFAKKIPPQLHRERFGFFKWPDFDQKLWDSLKSNADQKIQEIPFEIFGYDKDLRARNATAVNLMAASLEKVVKIDRAPFEKLLPPSANGILMMNPPYDERLKVEDTIAFYQSIGDRLKQHWAGWTAWIISSNKEALKHLGLRATRRITLFNGALECSLQRFEMYEGSKKAEETDTVEN